jgi:hypothetical protein
MNLLFHQHSIIEVHFDETTRVSPAPERHRTDPRGLSKTTASYRGDSSVRRDTDRPPLLLWLALRGPPLRRRRHDVVQDVTIQCPF